MTTSRLEGILHRNRSVRDVAAASALVIGLGAMFAATVTQVAKLAPSIAQGAIAHSLF